MVVAVTALLASTGHFIKFAQAGGETLATVLSLVMFTVPGVIWCYSVWKTIAGWEGRRQPGQQ